jgi:hypothetical protein
MQIDIDGLSEDELVDLNNRIVARLNFLKQAQAHSAMLEFRIGDRVTFTPEGRKPLVGVLTKYNRKTVTVITEGGQHWNVAPVYLRKAGTAKEDTSHGANVVPIKRE